MPAAALLLIDVQQAFDDPCWGARNNPDAESNIARLLEHWRAQSLPVIHVQHRSRTAGSPLATDAGAAFKAEAVPAAGEPVFVKSVNSAFIGTDLESYLHRHEIADLVVAGLTTDHCVSTTVRMAANLGFHVILVSDATATFARQDVAGRLFSAEEIHAVHLVSLSGEFCRLESTANLVAGR